MTPHCMQLPQDDFNLVAWQLGQRLTADDLHRVKQDTQV